MAAPCAFEPWLEGRLAALGLDGDVYGGYIRGVLREAECDAERLEGLAGALAAGEQDEDVLQEVCREIVERWSKAQNDGSNEKKEGLAITEHWFLPSKIQKMYGTESRCWYCKAATGDLSHLWWENI